MTDSRAIDDDDRLSGWIDGTLDEPSAAAVAEVCASEPGVRSLAELVEVRNFVRALEMMEPPDGFLESLVDEHESVPQRSAGPAAPTEIEVARARRRRAGSGVAASVAVAAAVTIAFLVPTLGPVKPALATDIRVHQAGAASSGDPVSRLAPLGVGMKFGK